MGEIGETPGYEGGEPPSLPGRQMRCGHTRVPAPQADHDVPGLFMPGGAEGGPITTGNVLPTRLSKVMNFGQSRLLSELRQRYHLESVGGHAEVPAVEGDQSAVCGGIPRSVGK